MIDDQFVAADGDCNLIVGKVVYISAIIDNDWNRQNENMFLLVNMMVQMVRGISLAKSGLASAKEYLSFAQGDLRQFAYKIKEPGKGIDKLTKVIMFGEDFDTEIDSFIEETEGRITKELDIDVSSPATGLLASLPPHGTLLFSALGGFPAPSLRVTTPRGESRSSGLCEDSPPLVTLTSSWLTGCPNGGCPATSAGSEGGSTFVFSHPSSAASPDAPRDARSEHQQRMLSPPRRLLNAAVATPDSSPGGLSALTSAYGTPGEGSPELGRHPESLGGWVARSLFRG
ncbi:MAG: hypothetical protein KBD64_07120 [Gammaproteobacteria bacterium]|nr:hypothetical protein [Gammaproteobacteria bacterium]